MTEADALAYLRLHGRPQDDPAVTDAELTICLANNRCPDSNRRLITDTGYETTYDLAGAVADIWELKASMSAGAYQVTREGLSLHREQVFKHCTAQAQLWRARAGTGDIHADNPAIDVPEEWDPIPN